MCNYCTVDPRDDLVYGSRALRALYQLRADRQSVAAICRTLHVSDVTLRGWLKRAVKDPLNSAICDRQLRLF